MNDDLERRIPWSPTQVVKPAPAAAPKHGGGRGEATPDIASAVTTDTGARQIGDFSGVAPAPSLKLDPSLGRLSLALSTFDGFDVDAAMLKPPHVAAMVDVVDKLSMLLAQMPAGRVTVTGHADLLGGESAELDLGTQRAAAIREALVAAGIPAERIQAAAAGSVAPVVGPGKADPANRRVDVRFEGELVVPVAAAPSMEGRSTRVDFAPKLSVPPLLPPLAQAPAPAGPLAPGSIPAPLPKQKPATTREEPTAKPGKATDLLRAISKVPTIENWIDRTKAEHVGKLKGLSPGEKVVVTTTVVSMGLLTGAGISTDPAARRFALDLIDGAELPLPGAPWLRLQARTKGGAAGAAVQLDLVKVFPGLR